tara:strand:+ start:828 stop:986 length:159 start_codon:yes stop_codon:yes gene_type:complete
MIHIHGYTTELLYHFICGNCMNWWSYASTEEYKIKKMYCPHCGKEGTCKKKQ